MRKMVRKILLLTLDNKDSYKTTKTRIPADSLIVAQVPSFMHVASIMNEVTNEEKETFGRVNISEISENEGYMNMAGRQNLTEANMDDVINSFLETSLPNLGGLIVELLMETVERSRARFTREFSKLQASYD